MYRIALLFYNLLFVPILLILLPGYLLRARRRGGGRSKAGQRFGILDRETLARIGTGRIWIHATSVGEVGIALKFAAAFRSRNPETRFLLSVTTSTGLTIAQNASSDWIEPIANPVDFPILTGRLVRKLRPSALVMVEADLWPNRVNACRAMSIPVILVNARLSEHSGKRFRRARFVTAPFFNQLGLITLTDSVDQGRWLTLGVREEILQLTGNIKFDEEGSVAAEPLPLPTGLGWGDRDPVLLAASTHEGEELEVARAFMKLRTEMPRLRLVIAPRHVERRASILQNLKALGLTCSLRSGEAFPVDLLLLDTTGELSRFYGRADAVFVGKSLPCSANRGGQNMIEPLQAGRPTLYGPHTGNFEPLASQLCEQQAALRVTDAESLFQALRTLLPDVSRKENMIRTAATVLEPHRGATLRTCACVEAFLGNRCSEAALSHSSRPSRG